MNSPEFRFFADVLNSGEFSYRQEFLSHPSLIAVVHGWHLRAPATIIRRDARSTVMKRLLVPCFSLAGLALVAWRSNALQTPSDRARPEAVPHQGAIYPRISRDGSQVVFS